LYSEFIYRNENKEKFEMRMLDTTIDELNLPVRAYHVLKRNKLLTVRDIIEFGPYNIIGLRNAGKKTIKAVLDRVLPYINTENIPSPHKYNSNLSGVVETIVPSNYSTFEDLIKSTFNQDVLNTPVDEIDISIRAENVLKKSECNTIGDIINFGLKNLIMVRNAGRKTINEIKNAILMSCKGEINKENLFNIIDTLNLISASVSLRDLDIIKARYGYKDGKCKTLEEIGSGIGITRERVRQIEVKAINRIRRKGKIFQPLLEATEVLLHNYKGIISVDEMVKDRYFKAGTIMQMRFVMKLLAELYKERYRVIYKDFLTSLRGNEIELFQFNIRKAILSCRFPIGRRTILKKIISSIGPISERYLKYHLLHKERVEIIGGRVIAPGNLSISEKIKLLIRDIEKPLHYTEIATLYKNHFGDRGIKASDFERSLHARIGDSKDFIIVNPGTFMAREKFKVPNNIEEIVDKSKEILRNLKTISDTRYLIAELKKQNINIGNLNEYSLKSILLEYNGFVGYKKFAMGIEEFADKYEKKYLRDLILETLLLSSEPLHSKKIFRDIQKKRGFRDYVVAKCLYDDPEFIKVGRSTFTVKEKINLYEEKRNNIISFAKEWIKLKANPISAFFVCEVLKEAEEVKDLPLGLVENVLATSPEFIRLPNGFYDLIQGTTGSSLRN
jgi:hypothetical protein